MIAPSQIQPEFQTLSASESIQFSWKSNIITQYGYQILFYKNSDNTLLFDTDLIVSTSTQYILPANNITNNLEIKYVIRQYSNSITYIDSEYILIKTSEKPVVTITNLPTNVQSYNFVADVTLSPNTSIQKYKFILYDNLNVIIQDTDYIYGYVPQYEFTGLVSGFAYKIKAIVYDQNNQFGESSLIPFTVNYTALNPFNLFTVTADNNTSGIQVDFTQVNQTSGVVTGNYAFTTGKFGYGLYMENGSFIEFSEEIPANYTITFYRKIKSGFTGDIISLGNNELRVFYDGTRYGYQFLDFITVGQLHNLPSTEEYIKVAIKYGKIIIQTSTYTEII